MLCLSARGLIHLHRLQSVHHLQPLLLSQVQAAHRQVRQASLQVQAAHRQVPRQAHRL